MTQHTTRATSTVVNSNAQGGITMVKIPAALLAALAAFVVATGIAHAAPQQAQHQLKASIPANVAAKAAAATGSLNQIIPGGVACSAGGVAVIKQRASYDVSLGQKMAEETGVADGTYTATDYVFAGCTIGAPGTVNNGVDNLGNVVATGDTTECNARSSRMVRIENQATGQVVLFCAACGNIRTHLQPNQPPIVYHNFVKQAVLHLVWVKQLSLPKKCPVTGLPVTVNVNVNVDVMIRARTWVRAVQLIKQTISINTTHSISIQVSVQCGQTPTPPTVPPGTVQFFKRWTNSTGGDITLGHTGDTLQGVIYDNGKVFPITFHPGTYFTVPGVNAGDSGQFCENKAFLDIRNMSLVDPATGVVAKTVVGDMICLPLQNMHGVVFIENHENGGCTSNCGPSTPPVCTSNCGTPPVQVDCSQVFPGSTWNNSLNACVIVVCGNVVIVNGSNNNINQGGNCNQGSPPPAPPTITNLTAIQELYVNETRDNICADANPQGGTGSVKFTSDHGSFSGGPVSVSGSVSTVCAGTFTAPSEPGTVTITATLYVNGQNPVSVSETVNILALPPRPLSDMLSSSEQASGATM